jgi:hypothetical protein
MISFIRTISQRRAAVVLAGLLTVAATSVASAHGGSRQGRYSNGVVVSRPCDVVPARRFATRQYWRGSIAGRRAGSKFGYDAGSCNGRYKPNPKVRRHGRSRSYRNGYATGYAEAYARSYRQAKRIHRKWANVPTW